jgi:hypothetical protein
LRRTHLGPIRCRRETEYKVCQSVEREGCTQERKEENHVQIVHSIIHVPPRWYVMQVSAVYSWALERGTAVIA